MRFITCGQASIDRSIMPDGTCVGVNLGGPGVFAYTGIRLYDDDCQMILNVAKDFKDHYGEWVKKNKVNTDALYEVYDKTHASDLVYQENGAYSVAGISPEEMKARMAEYGWTNVRADQIERHTRNADGMYIFVEPTYLCFWEQVHEISKRNKVRVMYEIGIGHGAYDREYVLKVLDTLKPEMSSLNHNEASDFFHLEDREEIFQRIYDWNIPMFFYRAGEEGSYVLHNRKSYFLPSLTIEGRPALDPTGCGNTSTAAATYAWIMTENPVMTGLMANVAAAYNVSYTGIIKEFTPEMRQNALAVCEKLYNEYVQAHPEYVQEGYPATGAEVLEKLKN